MQGKAPTRSFPRYKNPPVIEVVCGVTFKKIESFRAPHIGLFWQKVRSEYPICQHALPLLSEKPEFDEFQPPLPRVWFINQKEDRLIQLQEDRFLYNWRKMHEEEVYPSYQNVMISFKEIYALFKGFLEEEGLKIPTPTECELSYINHIPKGKGWGSVADIHEVLEDLNWRADKNRFLPEPKLMRWQALFALPEDRGRLEVKLEQGIRKTDMCPLLIIELSAHGLGGDKSEATMWDWFEVAHEWIVRGFTDLSSSKMQDLVWERTQ